ncbi:T9SS type A sorting domain-containing protein [bacterium]|nr:T9SS type A sorting domain-containing protein [bacterium]
MPRSFYLILLLPAYLLSQAADDLTLSHSHPILYKTAITQALELGQMNKPVRKTMDDDSWVIGNTDPTEIVKITESRQHTGNLIIMNNGQLIIENADFNLDGSISIQGDGLLRMTGGHLQIIQSYIYEHEAFLLEQGRLELHDVQFTSSGHSWSIGMIQNAHYKMTESEVSDGFITVALLHESTASISGSTMPGEFLCLGANQIELDNNDFLLMWLVLPEGCAVETSLPDGKLVPDWHFSSSVPAVTGIPYTVDIRNCTDVMWGLISNPNTQTTFSDTEFRALGLMFTEPDSTVVTGIVNNSTHQNDLIEISDRALQLRNSSVQTWSFYPSKKSNLTIENCITGEVLAQDSARVQLLNSVCDGTGGYIGAMNESFILCYGSLIRTQVIARMNSIFVLADCAITGQQIATDEQAIMYLANTLRQVEPEAHSESVIFEADIPLTEGETPGFIPIKGTARLLAGPANPIRFTGYDLAYASNFQEPDWQPIGGRYQKAVINDTLAMWNTAGLASGAYALQLELHHSYGDSINTVSMARLNEAVTAVKTSLQPRLIKLGNNYPNPFNPHTSIPFYLDKPGHVLITLMDIRGRHVSTLMDEYRKSGEHTVMLNGSQLASGIYIYILKCHGKYLKKTCMLVK